LDERIASSACTLARQSKKVLWAYTTLGSFRVCSAFVWQHHRYNNNLVPNQTTLDRSLRCKSRVRNIIFGIETRPPVRAGDSATGIWGFSTHRHPSPNSISDVRCLTSWSSNRLLRSENSATSLVFNFLASLSTEQACFLQTIPPNRSAKGWRSALRHARRVNRPPAPKSTTSA